MPETICWTCRRGPRSGCSWFEEHRPVPGWTAERRDILQQRWDGRQNSCFVTESYRVLACPLYQQDPPRVKLSQSPAEAPTPRRT